MGGAGGPQGGPGAGPGGASIVMPNSPPGLGSGPGTAAPGGGPPPMSPMAPGPAGTVPQVSNERRPGLTYNTSEHFHLTAGEKGSDEFLRDHPDLGLAFSDFVSDNVPEGEEVTAARLEELHTEWPAVQSSYQQKVTEQVAERLTQTPEKENDSAIVTEPEEEFVLKKNQELMKDSKTDKEFILETPKKRKVKIKADEKKYSILDPLATKEDDTNTDESTESE